MTKSTRARWTNGGVLAVLAVAMAVISSGDPFWGLFVPVLYAAGAVWASPIGDRPTRTHTQVQAMEARDRPVVVYARPGCTYCARMRLALLGAPPAVWVDIWDDPAAAAYVASVNGGDETVPTVVVDGEPLANPPPRRVRAALHSTAGPA